ncbi:MAG: helix-turn-helix transcriptional regulator [Proteobacteria bacterium]|nr:helix-turn-helix transcriptional regulator [Pseudomonadota bacterium]
MGSTLQQKIDQLSPEYKAEVEARADELILEELSLRALRKGLKRTQVEVAEALGIGQDTVSRLENRCNIMVSTLNRYIKAIGGEVSIVAEFPDRPPVKLTFDKLSNDLKVDRKKLATG